MAIAVLRVSETDPKHAEMFAKVPQLVRAAPYRRFLPPESYWEHHLRLGREAGAFWIALRDGQPVGRIGATLSPTRPGTAYVGFFEAVNDGDSEVCAALFQGVYGWLREQKVTDVYGPIDRNTWYGYRYMVPPEPGADADVSGEEDAFSWEPYQPPGYVAAFVREQFTVHERFHSLAYKGTPTVHVADAISLIKPAADFVESQGFRFVPFSKQWDEVLPEFFALGGQCFTRNPFFEPLGWDEFHAYYAGLGGKVDYSPSSWVEDANGRKCAMMFSYVDREYVVMKTVGVLPEFRRNGMSLGLLWYASNRAVELGLNATIGALYREGNASEGMARDGFNVGLAWRHHYVLFGRSLPSA